MSGIAANHWVDKLVVHWMRRKVEAATVDTLAADILEAGDNQVVVAILADNLGVAAGILGIPADRTGVDSSAVVADSLVGDIGLGRMEVELMAAEGAGNPAEEDSG